MAVDVRPNVSKVLDNQYVGRLFSKKAIPYWFLFPYFAFFTIFYGWPLLWAPWMSLQNFKFSGAEYVGLENYSNLIMGGEFFGLLYNTSVIVLLSIPISISIGLLLAVVVNSAYIKYKRIWRTFFLSPLIISSVVLSVLIMLLLEPFGLINWIIHTATGNRIYFADDPFYAKVAIAFVQTVGGIANSFIFFFAGMAGINENLYRAAKIDGAGIIQQFRHVTLPELRPMIVLVVLLQTNGGLKIFAPVQLITQGGPGGQSETLVFSLYREAFTRFNFGYAAALGVLLTIVVTILMMVEYYWGSDNE
jgi:ABC-type sugar transport system permease subunit